MYISFVNAPERFEDTTELMVSSIVIMQIPVRLCKLKYIKVMVERFNTNNSEYMDVIPKIIDEVLLNLKDSNRKIRETDY